MSIHIPLHRSLTRRELAQVLQRIRPAILREMSHYIGLSYPTLLSARTLDGADLRCRTVETVSEYLQRHINRMEDWEIKENGNEQT